MLSVILKAHKIWGYCPDRKKQKSFLNRDVKTKQNIKDLGREGKSTADSRVIGRKKRMMTDY